VGHAGVPAPPDDTHQALPRPGTAEEDPLASHPDGAVGSLPTGVRQARWISTGPSRWRDVEYETYRVIVELDGRVGHVEDGAFRDRRRDNHSTVRGRVTLRYGWTDTVADSCGTAAEVAQVLRANGWPGQPRACGQGCLLPDTA
jgi:hypothetical protein